MEMIIRFYGSPMQATLSRYLSEAFGSISRQQEAMQSEIAKALHVPFAPLTELTRQNMQMWEQMQAATRSAFTGAAAGPSSQAEPAASPRAASAARKRKRGK
jgi:polyhydroxyalkanoate synthesis regulator protein